MLKKVSHSILFVDDEQDITSVLEMIFRKRGFTVYTANSAEEALEVLAAKRVDIVISDEKMPGMTGSQLLSIVRREYPTMIRIILSGQANFKATLDAINHAQAHHFLVKPCAPDEIERCIARALEERGQKLSDAHEQNQSTEAAKLKASRKVDAALNALYVDFQPIVRAAMQPCAELATEPTDERVFAYEALVRCGDPELNNPYVLFEAARECDRVAELEHRTRELIALRTEELPPHVSMMVNVHPRSLADDDLYSPESRFFRLRHRVILEITDRDKLHEVPDATERLSRLRELGYRLAVDNLGAGFSGLNSFALIQPDLVKFDMQLIRNIQNSPTNRNLVRVMTQFCKETGILTAAEGIETAEECEVVRELGCDLLQGFFIARPMSPAEPCLA